MDPYFGLRSDPPLGGRGGAAFFSGVPLGGFGGWIIWLIRQWSPGQEWEGGNRVSVGSEPSGIASMLTVMGRTPAGHAKGQ